MSKNVIVTQQNCKKGLKVVRGRDWEPFYGTQDSGSVYGIITDYSKRSDWVTVQWVDKYGRNLHSNSYRIGDGDKYDLYIYEEQQTENIQIIGYKKIADYPGCPSKDTLVHYDGVKWWTQKEGLGGQSVIEPEKYPNFWEPIYGEKEEKICVAVRYGIGESSKSLNIIVKQSSRVIVVKSSEGDYDVHIDALKDLIKSLTEITNNVDYQIGRYKPTIEHVSFGCHRNIIVEDIEKVIDTWDKLNK